MVLTANASVCTFSKADCNRQDYNASILLSNYTFTLQIFEPQTQSLFAEKTPKYARYL